MSSLRVPETCPAPTKDCIDLHHAFAFRGLICDSKAVIEILGRRTYEQRYGIKIAYKNMYTEDLMKRLKSELHNSFERAMLLWMSDHDERDAAILRQCLKSWKLKIGGLAEIICVRSSSKLGDIVRAYQSSYGSSLQRDIESSMKGPVKEMLLQYLVATRSEEIKIDVRDDAKKMYDATEGGAHVDEAALIHLFSSRMPTQLCSILEVYKQLYGHELHEFLKKNPRELFDVLRIIIKCVQYPEKYFVKVLFKSMDGLGTDDLTLIRVVITRAEIDMNAIKAQFVRKYKKSVECMIKSDTSGSYKRFLLTLIGQNK